MKARPPGAPTRLPSPFIALLYIFAKLGVDDRTAAVTAAVTAALERGILRLGAQAR
jgi:hypothetical protein